MRINGLQRIHAMHARQSGVTLMELLTVIVIVGILASIAVPSYRGFVLRANRSDAKSALLAMQAAQEKFYLQNNVYTAMIDTAPPEGLGLTTATTHGYYTLRVEVPEDGQTYKAFAEVTPKGGQEDDNKCGDFSITDTGKREATGTQDDASCWK
jgi:type IV pilus assembly protein PilE